jgi:hypothetical protein
MEEIKRVTGCACKLKSAPLRFKSLPDRCFTAINEDTLKEETIPIGVPIEIDGRACIRFPCKDGHWKFSVTQSGMQEIQHTPFDPKSST